MVMMMKVRTFDSELLGRHENLQNVVSSQQMAAVTRWAYHPVVDYAERL